MRPRHVLLSTSLALAGCFEEVVDLRTPADPPLVCPPGERESPTSGRCEPCVVREPRPADACNCGHVDNPRPFPYCDSADADYDCAACRGSVDACATYGAVDPGPEECQRLRDCCDELAADPSSSPCCTPGETVFCEIASPGNALVFSCVSDS